MRFVEKNKFSSALVTEAQSLLNASKHYNQRDRVKDIIRSLYSGCCAFCECSPEDGSFFQIEHFYPKNVKRFSKYAKSIENLHYSCQRCNTLKGRKVHLNIFSPNYFLHSSSWIETDFLKIETELYYVGHLLFSSNSKFLSADRGKETIQLFDLNNFNGSIRSSRQHLIESRLRVYEIVYKILTALFELLSNYKKDNNNVIEILFSIVIKYTNRISHFSTMIIHNFGSDIYKLLVIYNLKKYQI
ncbi:hypothetical protein ACR780_14680 [Sphingobacterium faecium]|uniref:hypothetical protein n=1 Tax=Sphingobacterium faecium TaxID=34087 RepID=UPI003DA59F22